VVLAFRATNHAAFHRPLPNAPERRFR
jgi:hypothetical protein